MNCFGIWSADTHFKVKDNETILFGYVRLDMPQHA